MALVDGNTFGPQFSLGLVNLDEERPVGVLLVLEGVDVVTERAEEVGADRDECPQWQLVSVSVVSPLMSKSM